jgi:hypothetical protein
MKNIIMGLLLLSTVVFANPVTVVPGTSGAELFSLFSEAVVVSFLLTNKISNFYRLLVLWFVITFVTFMLFIWIGLGFTYAFLGSYLFFLPLVIIFETIIVIVEAKIMKKLSESTKLIDGKDNLTMKEAYKISFIGNVVSFLMGILLFWNRIGI